LSVYESKYKFRSLNPYSSIFFFFFVCVFVRWIGEDNNKFPYCYKYKKECEDLRPHMKFKNYFIYTY